jgi:hypothetical protein
MSGIRGFHGVFAVIIVLVAVVALPGYAQDGVRVTDLAIDPLTPDTPYTVTAAGIFKTTMEARVGGLSLLRTLRSIPWRSIPRPPPSSTPRVSGRRAESTDRRETWNATGLTGVSVWSLACS